MLLIPNGVKYPVRALINNHERKGDTCMFELIWLNVFLKFVTK